MSDETVLKQGFVVLYNKKRGGTGFITKDDGIRGTGYPGFSDKPHPAHIYGDISKAQGFLSGTFKSMKTYYGHEKVDFATGRIGYYVESYTVSDVTEADVTQRLAKLAVDKLTPAEYAALMKTHSNEIIMKEDGYE